MILENFRIALQSILANKLRSVLTTLGIIIGVASVIAVVSIVQGLNYVIKKELEGVGATYIRVSPVQEFNDPELRGREIRLTYEDGLAIMEQSTALRYFNPIFFRNEQFKYGDEVYKTLLLAVGMHHQEVVNHWVEYGRFFTAFDMERHARVCLIGQELIKKLKIPEPIIGQEIIIGRDPFTIIGVMEKKGEMFGQNRDELALIPITTAQDVYPKKAFDLLILDFQARSAELVEMAKDEIEQILRRRHNIRPGEKDDFRVVLQEEMLKTTGSILGVVTSVVGSVVGISLLVGAIGIMNIMLVSVTERTREIGLRKAVGARRSDILIQFLIEAFTLSLLGGVPGVLFGWVLGIIGARAIPGFPSAHVPLWAIMLGFGFAGAVGILFGTYPAAKASRLDPIEALRHE